MYGVTFSRNLMCCVISCSFSHCTERWQDGNRILKSCRRLKVFFHVGTDFWGYVWFFGRWEGSTAVCHIFLSVQWIYLDALSSVICSRRRTFPSRKKNPVGIPERKEFGHCWIRFQWSRKEIGRKIRWISCQAISMIDLRWNRYRLCNVLALRSNATNNDTSWEYFEPVTGIQLPWGWLEIVSGVKEMVRSVLMWTTCKFSINGVKWKTQNFKSQIRWFIF